MPNGRPTFWLIAGPEGAGRTTYAMRHLKAVSGSINFVNMDEIARGLSPIEPAAGQTEAARIALSRARAFIRDGANLWRIQEASGPRPVLALEGRRTDLRFADAAILDAAHPAVRPG